METSTPIQLRKCIIIKINSPEYKAWLQNRNKKRLALRTRKKAAKKKSLAYLNDRNRELKGSPDYNPKTKRFDFHAPLVFSFIWNPEETNAFFSKIINFITCRENFGKSLFIDVSKIDRLSSDALMYLLAIVNNLNENFRNKFSFSGNAPDKPEVKKLFAESGFYQFVKYQGTDPIIQNKDNIQIVSGENSDTSVAKRMSDFVSKKAGISRQACSFIYIMMIELMSNTHKHAYADRRSILFPRWYCFSEYDGKDTISFTFMDTGDGVPATVRKNFAERIDFLKIKGDSKYVTSALDGDFRTSTELSFRGKGLPKIREFCAQSKIQNMRIITNYADVTVYESWYNANNLITPLRGTLFFWQIDISKLKGV